MDVVLDAALRPVDRAIPGLLPLLVEGAKLMLEGFLIFGLLMERHLHSVAKIPFPFVVGLIELVGRKQDTRIVERGYFKLFRAVLFGGCAAHYMRALIVIKNETVGVSIR